MILPPPTGAFLVDEDGLDATLAALPDAPAVFVVWAREGEPYLARTAVLRRRLTRLLGTRERASAMLHLRHVAARVEWWRTGSRLESSLVLYGLTRRHRPDDYTTLLKLRLPHFVKLILDTDYPRCQVTQRLGGKGAFYGPFRTRAQAEAFAAEMLGLFRLRRCHDDWVPSPDHPGCVYGEIGQCLRPCQQAVTGEEYRAEVRRVRAFLATDGLSLLEPLAAERQHHSEALDFEAAARAHERHEQVRHALQFRDELARDVDRLCGVCVVPAAEPDEVLVWPVVGGLWREPSRIVRAEAMRQLTGWRLPNADDEVSSLVRQEQIALLGRWVWSSWRDGEWLPLDPERQPSLRKLAGAVQRAAKQATAANSP